MTTYDPTTTEGRAALVDDAIAHETAVKRTEGVYGFDGLTVGNRNNFAVAHFRTLIAAIRNAEARAEVAESVSRHIEQKYQRDHDALNRVRNLAYEHDDDEFPNKRNEEIADRIHAAIEGREQ